MKAVLMAFSPEECEKIFSGKKTVDVRKVAPKLETPYKVYMYQIKEKGGAKIINDCLNSVYGGGSAVAYAWFVWQKGYTGTTEVRWI